MTDRAGWAVCVVGPDLSRVGCDLEIVEARSRGFVSDFLTDGEQGFVAAQADGDARDAAANLLWSAKESALKVLRTGLRRDTRIGGGHRPSPVRRRRAGWVPAAVRPSRAGRLPGWWRRDGAFLLTIAADVPDPAAGAAAGLGLG